MKTMLICFWSNVIALIVLHCLDLQTTAQTLATSWISFSLYFICLFLILPETNDPDHELYMRATGLVLTIMMAAAICTVICLIDLIFFTTIHDITHLFERWIILYSMPSLWISLIVYKRFFYPGKRFALE